MTQPTLRRARAQRRLRFFEQLEARQVMAGTLSANLASGVLTVTDLAGAENHLSLEFSDTTLTISDALEQFSSAPAGGSLSGDGHTLTMPVDSVSGVALQAAAGADVLTINSSASAIDASLTISGGSGADQLTFASDLQLAAHRSLNVNLAANAADSELDGIVLAPSVALATAGTGQIDLRSSGAINLQAGSSITSEDGILRLWANQQGTAASGDVAAGLQITGATVHATGAGDLDLRGRGGDLATPNHGVSILQGSLVQSNSGNVEITGIGGVNDPAANYGIFVHDSNVGSIAGNITLFGMEGAGSLAALGLSGSAAIDSAAGEVVLVGDSMAFIDASSVSSGNVVAIRTRNAGQAISLGGVTGPDQLGLSTADLSHLSAPLVKIQSQLEGLISVDGPVSADSNLLLSTFGAVTVSSAVTMADGKDLTLSAASIALDGAAAALAVTGSGVLQLQSTGGLSLAAGASIASESTDVLLRANAMEIVPGAAITASENNKVIIRNHSDSVVVRLGSEREGSLSLTDAELDCIAAGTLQVGDGGATGVQGAGTITYDHHLSILTAYRVWLGYTDAFPRFSLTLAPDRHFTVSALDDVVIWHSDIALAGTGSISITSPDSVVVRNLTTVDGDIDLSANQQAVPKPGNYDGVNAYQVHATGTGNITILGRGGTQYNFSNKGVIADEITVHDGDLRIVGEGGNKADQTNDYGVALYNLAATGAGSIDVTGASGDSARPGYRGIEQRGQITTNDGDISLTGVSRNSNTTLSVNEGIVLYGDLSAGGAGRVVLQGQGGGKSTGLAIGVYMFDSLITTAGGDILVSASGGAEGMRLEGTAEITTALHGGDITLAADTIRIFDTASVKTLDTAAVHLQTKTPGAAIQLGGPDAPGVLGLTSAELGRVSTGTIEIGKADSGPITFVNGIARISDAVNFRLISGADIALQAGFGTGALVSGGGSITLTPGAEGRITAKKAGIDLNAAGQMVDFGTDATLRFSINGAAVDTQYDQLNVVGGIDLTDVKLSLGGTYVPGPGESFVLVQNDAADPIVGQFAGLAEGAVLHVGGRPMRITYTGGSGNDVVLLDAPPTPVIANSSIDPTHGITVTFDEPVTDFTAEDIAVANGTISNFDAVDAQTYRFDVTPDAVGEVTLNIAAGAAHDLDGQASNAAAELVIEVGSLGPTLTVLQGLLLGEGSERPITAQFLFAADPNSAADQVVYTVTVAPLHGVLVLSTAPNDAIDSFTQDDVNSGRLIYRHDGGESTADSFEFTVADEQPQTIGPYTLPIAISPINDAPLLTVNAAASYVENEPPVVLSPDAVVQDVDSSSLNAVSVQIVGAITADRLAIRDQGTAAGQIGLTGYNTVTYGGIAIGTYSVSTSTLSVALNGSASPAAVQALLRNITFQQLGDNPSSNPRTVRFVVSDGNRATEKLLSLSIVPVDDPFNVQFSANSSVSENAGPTRLDSNARIVDPDGTDFRNGSFEVTITSGAMPGDVLDFAQFSNFSTTGGEIRHEGVVVGTWSGGNGATPLTVNLNDQANSNSVWSLLAALRFDTTEDMPLPSRSLLIEVTDATGLTRQVSHTITVEPSNDSPVIRVDEAATVYENGNAVLLAPNAEVYDPDSTAYPGGRLSFGGVLDAFEVTIRNQGTGAGQIGVSGTAVSYGGVEFGTIRLDQGQIYRVDFNEAATKEAVQALVRNIMVRCPNETVRTETISVPFVLQDDDPDSPNIVSEIPLNTVGNNDRPVFTNVATKDEYIQNDPPLAFFWYFVLHDPDPAPQYADSTATFSIVENGEAVDRLSIITDNTISVVGNKIAYGGLIVATFSGGTSAEPLSISFDNIDNIAAANRVVSHVLQHVGFSTSSNTDPALTRTIELIYADSEGAAATPLLFPIHVTLANDAPVLDNSLDPRLPSIAEDTLEPAGTQVLTLLKGAVTDPDPGALRGIAVTAAANAFGTWQYKLNNASPWVGMDQPTSSEALLLPGWSQVRFLPALNFNGTVKLFYRAWDQTEGMAGGALDVATHSGGHHSLSLAGENASLTVKPVNDAPVLDTTSDPTLDPVWEDAKSPAGTLVSKFASAAISDVDANARKGIAVTSVDAENGKWQFSLDGGKTWQNFGVVSEDSARLLAADSLTKVRFIPNPDFDEQVTLTFRAWDRTEGTAGQTLSTFTRTGGTGTFSSAFDLATLTMVARNDKPVLKLGSAVGYVHDTTAIAIAPNASVEDVDSPDFDGGWLRVHIADGANLSNRLMIGGDFTIDANNNVLLGSAIIGKRASNGWGTNDLLIEFKPAATRAIVQQLVRSLMFKTVGGVAGTRLLQFSLADGDGGVSDVAEKTVNVT